MQRQPDRLPLEDYEAAIWRLVGIRQQSDISASAWTEFVHLVADVFWKTDARVAADAARALREIT